MKRTLISILTILLISSCETPIDTMDNMDKNTSEMKDTTQLLNDKTSDMKEITELLYRQSRKPETIKVQEIAINGLQNNISIERKLFYSVMFVGALEYTLWTGKYLNGDSIEYLFDLYYEGVMNVTTLASELSKRARLNIDDIKTISPATKNSDEQNLLVLAYALGERGSEQMGLARRYGIKPLSFFELSEQYLRKTAVNNKESSLTESELSHRYIRELTQSDNKRIIINLINLRMNIFTAMILAKVSKIDRQYKKTSFGILSTINKAKHLLSPWKVSFGLENESMASKNSKINLMNSWVNEALKAKYFLKEIGEEPILDKMLVKILEKMRFKRISGLNFSSFESNIKKLKE